MKIKCIAIGNRIMGDDGIGVMVLEQLRPQLENKNIEVIIGETDIIYTLSKIEDGDMLFIFDSTYFNNVPGKVTIIPIEEANKQIQQNFSQHQLSLIKLLNIYKKEVTGYILGIEVHEINFSLQLSDILAEKFTSICEEINEFIDYVVRGD